MSRFRSVAWLTGLLMPLLSASLPAAAADLDEQFEPPPSPPPYVHRAPMVCDEYGRCFRERYDPDDDVAPPPPPRVYEQEPDEREPPPYGEERRYRDQGPY